MPDSHSSGRHARSILGLLLELTMIVVGVFLGLMAEQWRETRHERDLAQASLRNFRNEIIANGSEIRGVREYHTALAQNLQKFMATPGRHTLNGMIATTHFQGMHTVDPEHTAWDLALATQSLSYIKPDLAYAISRLYTRQQSFQTMENSFMQATFTPSTFADTSNGAGLTVSMMAYLGDVNIQEPMLLKSYSVLLPKIDSVLGEPEPTLARK